MASAALAFAHKEVETRNFLPIQSRGIAAQVAVEAAVEPAQRAHVGGQRPAQIALGERRFFISESAGKLRRVALAAQSHGHGTELPAHFGAVRHDLVHLVFEKMDAAVVKQGRLQRGVEQRGRITSQAAAI